MTDPEDRTQIYLITPPALDLDSFPDLLGAALDAVDVSCLRLKLYTDDADALARAADTIRAVAHGRDVPFVVEKHLGLVERLGLDGVHLPDGARTVRKARETLGADAIVGAFCGRSRHDGITAGEAGADYVAFGPAGDAGLGAEVAPLDLFGWWSDMIEIPVVAEGALILPGDDPLRLIRDLAPVADFLGLGEDLWAQPDPVATLRAVAASLG